IGIESDHGIGIKIVAQTNIPVGVGLRIPDAPECQVRLCVVGSGRPDAGATGLPRLAGPRFIARLAGAGNVVEPPDFLAGLCVVGCEEPAYGAVSSCSA